MVEPERQTGEEAIVQRYLRPLAQRWPGAFDLLDDCALVSPAPGHELVVKTDPVRAGVHFIADDAASDIAWKALAVNVSDVAAKAARPLAYTMAMSFPDAPTRKWMEQFSSGLRAAQDAFGCTLIGGDTDRADGPLSIAVTLFGEVPLGRMIPRAGPRVGDLLCVTGSLGTAALGLRIRQGEDFDGLTEAMRKEALARFLRPMPRLGLRAALRAEATAAMDLSDGLGKDLGRMCAASGTGARVELNRIPECEAVRLVAAADLQARLRLISSGDDYEILCAVPPDRADHFVAHAAAGGETVSIIGEFTDSSDVVLIDESGSKVDWQSSGYDHFAVG